MFLENFWGKVSFDILPTLPIVPTFLGILLLFAFTFLPAYIVYAKQSLLRKRIYLFCLADFILFYICIFIQVEDFYFDRGSLTVFAKTLFILLLIGSILDVEDRASYLYVKKGFIKKYIKHPLEAGGSYFLYFFFKLLPRQVASAVGGIIGRGLGSFQSYYNKLVMANLNIAFPKKKLAEKIKIRSDMWDMLGRYFSEPSHFMSIYRNQEKYLQFENDEILEKLKGKPFIVLIAHYGSVGLVSIPFANRKVPCSIIYKYPSNNLTNQLVIKSFGNGIGKLSFIPNRSRGTKEALKVLSQNGAVLTTPDQHFQTGVDTKFFGQKVKSPIGTAKLAIHFNCPILPVQLVRVKGLHHKIIFHEPFLPFDLKDKEEAAIRTTQKINDITESWIRENPSQWFWVHDRFKIKSKLGEDR